MNINKNTMICTYENPGLLTVADKTSTREMSIVTFCIEFNRYQKSLAEPDSTGSIGACPDVDPAPLQASDFPCLAIQETICNSIAFVAKTVYFTFNRIGLAQFNDYDFTRDNINTLISVTKTTYSELKPGNHFFATGEKGSSRFPMSPSSLTEINYYHLLREDGIWFGCDNGEIAQVDHDWFKPETTVFLFTLKES